MQVFNNFLHIKHIQNNNVKKTNHIFKAQSIFKFTKYANYSSTATSSAQTLGDKKSKKIVILSGISGLGKTSISLEIAKKMRDKGVTTEIISNDAVQVYRGLDIGSYKVPRYEREIVPHHLLDIYDTNDSINAGDFFDMAIQKIDEVLARGNVPILVGATTYYLKWLLFGKQAGPVVPREVESKYYKICLEDNDWDKSYQRLLDVDPIYAQKVLRNNYQRLCKALSKIEVCGKPLHALDTQSSKSEEDFEYDFRPFYLIRPKLDCKRILDYRVELMVQSGFITEVARLMKNGFRPEHHAARAVGYKATMDIISSNKPIDSNLVKHWLYEIQANTRQAASSQLKFARLGEMGEAWRWIDMQHFTRRPDPISIENNTINAISDLIIENLKLSIIEHNSDKYKSSFARPNYIVSSPKDFKNYIPIWKVFDKKQNIMDLIYEFTSARHYVSQKTAQ